MGMGIRLSGRRGTNYYDFGSCLKVAVTFGCSDDDYPLYEQDVERSGYEERWLVSDAQARDIAYALFKAIDHVKERRPLTEVQAAALSAAYFPEIVKLANYAIDGHFDIVHE